MIWLTGSVAIALMLMILALSPNQVLSLNITHSQHYIWISYLLLGIAVLCGLSASIIKSQSRTIDKFPSKKIKTIIGHSTRYLTPLYNIKQQGKLTLVAKVMCVVFFWLAVICHTLGQRVDAVQAMPSQPIYVDALVTFTELSDKRLTLESNQINQDSSNTQKQIVTQGYRQLVTLTDIEPYTQRQSLKSDVFNQTADNPFLDSKPDSSLSSDKNYNQLDSQTFERMTVMLYSYQADSDWLNSLAPNKQVRMRLELRPLETEESESGFNEYRWLSTRHATAIAKIINANPQNVTINHDLSVWQKINMSRYRLREHFLYSDFFRNNNRQDAAAVTLSLLTGDRSLISTDMTDLYRFAGISHLLAISGAHVLFLAILIAMLISLLTDAYCPQLYRVLPRWQLRLIVAVSIAFVYAMFAGFDVPAVRTAWMLIIVGVVRYLLAAPAVFKILLILAVALGWQDIFVLWQAGYWLSFTAVTVLIVYSQRFGQQSHVNAYDSNSANTASLASSDNDVSLTIGQKVRGLLFEFFKLQLWMSIALLPISLWLFGKVSLWGLIVNIFAIGFFGWVIVPLDLLAGLSYTVSATVADGIWSFITWLLSIFHGLLSALQVSASQVGWVHSDISVPILILMILMVLPFFLPKGMMSRYLSIPALLAVCMASFATSKIPQDQTRIISVDTANHKVSATLITHDDNNWLLLSAYGSKHNPNVPLLDVKQKQRLSQHLYDRLRSNRVDVLTGIVVQTADSELADIVANLRTDMQISYYWQAGLKANKAEVESVMKGLGLTPQSCTPNRHWSKPHSKDEKDTRVESIALQAVTGWQEIKDSTVHDCTIRISSPYPVILINAKDTQDITPLTPTHNSSTDVILYSSSHLNLSKMWALMCTNNIIGAGRTVETTGHHWLISPQSTMNKSLLDAAQPQSFQIIGNSNNVTKSLQEAQLKWQQRNIAIE